MEKDGLIPSDIIDEICTGSDSQIDESLKPRLKALKNREDVDNLKLELQQIIGDSINYSLVSGFVLTIMQTIFYVDMLSGNLDDVVGKITSTKIS